MQMRDFFSRHITHETKYVARRASRGGRQCRAAFSTRPKNGILSCETIAPAKGRHL
jgi:hypothetical protein